MLDPNKAVEQMQSEFSAGFQAGAASRDAEVQRLQFALSDTEALELGTAERCDQLRTQINTLRAVLEKACIRIEEYGFEIDEHWKIGREVLNATKDQP